MASRPEGPKGPKAFDAGRFGRWLRMMLRGPGRRNACETCRWQRCLAHSWAVFQSPKPSRKGLKIHDLGWWPSTMTMRPRWLTCCTSAPQNGHVEASTVGFRLKIGKLDSHARPGLGSKVVQRLRWLQWRGCQSGEPLETRDLHTNRANLLAFKDCLGSERL